MKPEVRKAKQDLIAKLTMEIEAERAKIERKKHLIRDLMKELNLPL